jgi:chromatin segregation and condensation protein Rec8/ScpA/Scc1 (kleisin family)
MGFLEALGGRGTDRALLVGAFLALLELVRQGRVAAEQAEPFGEIRIVLRESTDGGRTESPGALDGPSEAG